jgi:chromosome partitioning protein
MRVNTTLVINPKGGSGKTTVATNLASYFASKGVATTILDYDPQGSSLNWLRQRPLQAARIHGANGAPQKTGLRTVQMHVPANTEQLIIDAPAGASGMVLTEMLMRAHSILIPVAPSAIDIHATANFIRDLLLKGMIRQRNIRLAACANRVRSSMPVYAPLERFLSSLSLQMLSRVGDSDVYLKSAETGIGVFEMEFAQSAAERQQLMPITEWMEMPEVRLDPRIAQPRPSLLSSLPGRTDLRVVSTASIPAFLTKAS